MIAIDLHFSVMLILFGLIILVEYLIWRRRKRKVSFLGIAAITLYALLLFKVTICPIVFLREESRQEFQNFLGNYISYYQLIPFKTMLNTFQTNAWFLQILGNVLLLFPMPILYSLLAREIPSIKFSFVMGAIISLGIELLQLGIDMIGHYPSHIADIDDFILNVLGVTISAVIVRLIHKKSFYIDMKRQFRKE